MSIMTASKSLVAVKSSLVTGKTTSSTVSTMSSRRSVCSSEIVKQLTNLESPDLLRGTPYVHVLRAFGNILYNSQGSASSYALSQPVDQISAFISHNWSVPATAKFLALTLYFNGRFATFCTLVVAIMIFLIQAHGFLPRFDFADAPEGHQKGIAATLVCPIVFWSLLTFKHELYRLFRVPSDVVFLDKTCIHQTDVELKRKGIESLSAFIEKSTEVVVVFTDEYLQKLWTVYELATFLILFPEKPVVLLPTGLAPVIHVYIVSLTIQNLLSFIPVTPLAKLAGAASFVFPVAIMACYMRHRARSLDRMQKAVDTFSLAKTKCFVESDRALVQANIVSFLKHSKMVDEDMPDAQALHVFDTYVQSTFGQAIRRSVGEVGIQYRWILVAILTGSGVTYLELVGGLVWLGVGRLELTIAVTEMISFHFNVIPIILALIAIIARRNVEARGVREVLIVAFAVFASMLTGMVAFLVVSVEGLHKVAKTSTAGLVMLLAYHVLLSCVTFHIYASSRWKRALCWRSAPGATETGPAGHPVRNAPGFAQPDAERHRSEPCDIPIDV
eukprot:TRINITY_DN11155_c0_g2_i5.p1 TRINITY_DN11155_c0_g2~~TRINITY_DN11155_c0_g2_i5.p1  ORF type:complete len:559 (+),score=76.07 TRINITY_DN11155_c0_g2_i5:567-2243(+)